MAYETGVSTSPSNLLSKIEIFTTVTLPVPERWTLIRNNGAPGGQLSISDPTASEANQFNFIADDTAETAHIACQPSRADDGDGLGLYYQHPGSPVTSGPARTARMGHPDSATNQGFGGSHVAYHLFSGSTSDGFYLHVVCEGDAGVFFHLSFGTIEKAGAFSGGQYVTAMQTNDDVQICWPFSWFPGGWNSTQWLRNDDVLTGGTITTDGGTSRWTEDFGMTNSSTSLSLAWYGGGVLPWSQRTPFGPNLLVTWESLSVGDFVILGHTPDIRLVSMNGRVPGEVVTLGSDDWHLFPVHVKNSARGGSTGNTNSYKNTFHGTGPPDNDSNLAGFAYREIP